MKNIIKYIGFTLSIGLLLTSCEDKEEFTGESVLAWGDQPITVTSSANSYTFDEAAMDEDVPSTYSVSVSASIAEAQPVSALITFKQTGGNADSDDYSVGNITIPAGATSGSTNIEVNYTGDVEGSESFTLEAIADGNFNLSSAFSVTVTIEDKVNDVLDLSTNWSGEYSYSAGSAFVTLDFCEVDVDVLLFTSTGSFMGFLGATGACTEVGSLSGLSDGDYFIVLDLYDNPHAQFGATATVPITVTYNQDYIGTSGSFTYTGINLSSPSDLYAAAIVSVSGYNYTITAL
jgi:hypothetical protein